MTPQTQTATNGWRSIERASANVVAVTGPLAAVYMVMSGEPWVAVGALAAGYVAIVRQRRQRREHG